MNAPEKFNQMAGLEVRIVEVSGRLCAEFRVAGESVIMSLNDLRRATGEIDLAAGHFSPEHQENLAVYQEALRQYREKTSELSLA